MSTQTQTQPQPHRSQFFLDGLVDLALGVTALCFGAAIWSEVIFLAWILPAALAPTWIMLRQETMRQMRRHHAAGNESAHQKSLLPGLTLATILAILGLVVFLAFALGVVDSLRPRFEQFFPLALGGLAASILAITGLFLSLRRFYLYAGLLILLFASGYLFQLTLLAGLVIFGGLVLTSGISLLIRFYNQHNLITS